MLVSLANSLLRDAQKTDNARGYLDGVRGAKLTTIGAQGGGIISTTVNGKSVTFQALAGTTIADYHTAALMALEALECGLTRVPRSTWTVLR